MRKGQHPSEDSRRKMAIAKMAENNPMWKGDGVSYRSLHEWVTKHLSKPLLCQNCGLDKKLDLANKSGKYLRVLTDWEWLCRVCHMTKDGRINRRDGQGHFAKQTL